MKGLLLLALLVGGIALLFSGDKPAPSSPADISSSRAATENLSAPVATIDKSEDMQADRLDLLNRLMSEGVFTKLEMPGNLARAYVAPSFYQLTIDDKERFVGVVYAYYYDGSSATDLVRVFDGRSGNEVGLYSVEGLDMF